VGQAAATRWLGWIASNHCHSNGGGGQSDGAVQRTGGHQPGGGDGQPGGGLKTHTIAGAVGDLNDSRPVVAAKSTAPDSPMNEPAKVQRLT
jgi:hypothetical protein